MQSYHRFARLPVLIGMIGLLASACSDNPTEVRENLPPPPPDTLPSSFLIDRAPLSAAGGQIEVDNPESALHGMIIEVAPGSYSGATEWSISEHPEIQPELPAGMEQVGPAIRIRNGQGYADSALVLRIPAPIDDGEVVAAFYYEPETGTLELVPPVEFDGEWLWVHTKHLSAEHLLIPNADPAPAVRTAGMRTTSAATPAPAFGEVSMVLVKTDGQILTGSLDTPFRPGVHDWEFPNYGSYASPGGFCAGSTLTALYHHYRFGGKTLYEEYDSIPGLWEDNGPGIRMASMVQNLFDWKAWGRQISTMDRASLWPGDPPRDWVQAATLAMALELTGRPQLLGILTEDFRNGHALVAYGTSGGTILIADPNAPGDERSIEFDGESWLPFTFSERVDGPEDLYTRVYTVGASAIISMEDVEDVWEQFESGIVRFIDFPLIRTEYLEPADTIWRVLGDTIRTASDSITVRTLCESCDPKRMEDEPGETDRVLSVVVNRAGSRVADDLPDDVEGAAIPLTEAGIRHYGIAQGGIYWVPDPNWFFIDFTWFHAEKTPFELSASSAEIVPEEEVTFTVDHGGLHERGFTFRWDLGDGSEEVLDDTWASLRHEYASTGTYMVRVELLHPDGGLLARDSLEVVVSGASFEGLGILGVDGYGKLSSQANGVSADGTVVVGVTGSDGRHQAFRWTAGSGMEGIGFLDGSSTASMAYAISADGTVIVGQNVGENSYTDARAFRWTAEDGMQSLGVMGHDENGKSSSMASGVSADGSVIVGSSSSAPGGQAFRWTAGGGMQGLGFIGADQYGDGYWSSATDVSDDGSVVIGSSSSPSGNSQTYRWVNGSMQAIPFMYGGSVAGANDVSGNGLHITGYNSSPGRREAFLWSDGSMQGIGTLAASISFDSRGHVVSNDGSVIAGISRNAAGAERVFIWTSDDGMRLLKSVLEQEHGLDLTGWSLRYVNAISHNGSVLVGWGVNPDGNVEAWRAVM